MRFVRCLIGINLLSCAASFTIPPFPQQILGNPKAGKEKCPLPPKVTLDDDNLFPSLRYPQDETVLQRQVSRLSKAVQIPTAVTDSMKDPHDESFAPFVEFHQLLAELFPQIHSKSKVERINRLGLVITLDPPSGTRNQPKKPLLFTAHQDVVPIDDASDWTHPPFSGYFDGEFVWGRGSSDCKNGLIGLLSVVEDLLNQDWTPSRPVVLAFGFDEEAHGYLGAGKIAPLLEERYGKDGVEFILDEGGMGLSTLRSSSASALHDEEDNVIYALPDVGEKGALDIILSLSVPGGHSSVPPKHTGIGIMSEIIYNLENTELDIFTPSLGPDHPTRRMLECQVHHSPQYVETWLASALDSDDYAATAESVAQSRGDDRRFTLQSSQAADIFNGGVKSNALPEKVRTVVNYRVGLHQTPDMVQERAEKIIEPIIAKYNLTWSRFSDTGNVGADSGVGKGGHLTLSTSRPPLSPAPVSPTDIETSPVWARFAGVTRSVFESVPSLRGKTVVVSGDIMTGNTDTRFYWNLSRNIYRWSPAREGRALNIHTVDERIGIDAHLEAMMLYYDLIRAFDQWDGGVDQI
ncbi:Gly-Xaa carboxypeptidase [Aspergillus lucknowensis]|uniref:Peptidase M20 dimerisation domain-containing protein n=1 Tax=Aspergillus lucknowensis TaxID=176173 RepID=A0ABR4LV91_9EURO